MAAKNYGETQSIIGIIDVDSYECQIWLRKLPKFKGRPCVVADKCNRIVSVSTEAKLFGVTRDHRVNEAKAICPNLKVFWKPQKYNKPDSQETRQTSYELQDIISSIVYEDRKYFIALEHVPTDQWFFDLTDYIEDRNQSALYDKNICIVNGNGCERGAYSNSFIHNYDTLTNEEKLTGAAFFMRKITNKIFEKTGFTCSGGVANNLLLAKIASNLNKPNGITVLTSSGFHNICHTISIVSVPGFKNSLGSAITTAFRITSLEQLKKLTIKTLKRVFPDHAKIIYNTARGISDYYIQPKWRNKQINCRKNNLYVTSNRKLRYHLNHLCAEMLHSRLNEEYERNRRLPHAFQIKFALFYTSDRYQRLHFISKTIPYTILNFSCFHPIAQRCYEVIVFEKGFNCWYEVITSLCITAKDLD